MKLSMNRILTLIVASFVLLFVSVKGAWSQVLIIPQPKSVETETSEFTLKVGTPVFLPVEFQKDMGPYIKEKIKNDIGIDLSVSRWAKPPLGNYLRFEKVNMPELGSEGYDLEVTPQRVIARANTYAGLLYAFQTLRQIIPSTGWQVPGKGVKIKCLVIKDNPRFEWRGVMLDVARHFQPKEYIMKQIDIFSSYKINKLHLHLTDDQGWRIEIKRYPNLTKKGAWRADRRGIAWWSRDFAKSGEPTPIGGFYSHEDIREIVDYARIRNVEIIPEIDLPGHSKALKASYPILSCREDILFEVSTGGRSPNNTICPGRESTYQFIDGVIDEVSQLFPSKYIHIGGDECNKSDWEKCPECNKRMKQEHLSDYDELQSYFITRIDSQMTRRGKTVIGWDEILSGKGTPGAVVMAWRRNRYSPEVDAPRAGYKTIQASYTDSYINNHQGPPELEPEAPRGIIPLKKVYQYEPVPAVLTPKEAALIMGSQVCLWGEFTPNTKICELMLYPRVLANAEVGWTQKGLKDWKRFQHAVEDNFIRLERDHVNYSGSTYNPFISFTVDTIQRNASVQIISDSDIHDLYYSIDGNIPSTKSKKYTGPFICDLNSIVKAGIFDINGKLIGEVVTKGIELTVK